MVGLPKGTKKMSNILFNACPKCWGDPFGKTRGPMRLNIDGDLSCIMCGKVVVLAERREYDSRDGKKRDYSEKGSGADVDKFSRLSEGKTWDRSTQNNNSTMARQGSLFRAR